MSSKRVLVLTVGTSSDPLIESIKRHRPDNIYFLASDGTASKIDEILSEAYPSNEIPPHKKSLLEGEDFLDLGRCFEHSVKILEDIKKDGFSAEDIIVDPTGGSKAMSSGLLMAAPFSGVTISYVKSKKKEYPDIDTNKPYLYDAKVVDGYHPYEVLARQDKVGFCQSFNNYRFTSAIGFCETIVKKGGERLAEPFQHLKEISMGYRDWDLFRLNEGKKIIARGLKHLEYYLEKYPNDKEKLFNFVAAVKSNLLSFEDILYKTKSGKVYSFELVNELVANALRRSEEGRYDDAVARLYRAMEMIGQTRIWEIYEVETSAFPYDKLSADLKDKLKPNEDGFVKLANFNTFVQLQSTNDEYGKRYIENESKILSLLGQRNNSILAHGKVPLNEKKFTDLYKIFKDVFGIDGSGIEFAKIEENDLISIGI